MTAPQDPFSTPPQGRPDDSSAGYGPPPGGQPAGYGEPAGQPAPYGTPGGAPAGYGAAPYGQQPGAFGAPGGFGQGGFGGHASPKNGFGVAALVLGILSLFSWFFFIGGLLGLIAIILGVLGRGRVKRGEANNGGMALAGIITGALGLLLTGLAIAGIAALFSSDSGQDLIDCINNASTPADQQACEQEFGESIGG